MKNIQGILDSKDARIGEELDKISPSLRYLYVCIRTLSEMDRGHLIDALSERYCTKCWDFTDGRKCWACYDSYPEHYPEGDL